MIGRLLGLALLLALPVLGRAQLQKEVGPVELSLSGYIKLTGAVRHDLFSDGVRTRYVGENAETLADPRLSLLLRARSTADWFALQLRLVNRRFPDVPFLGADRSDYPEASRPLAGLELWPEEAYLETGPRLAPWYLRAGLQHLRYALRPTGGSLLIDVPEAESPFDRAPLWSGLGGRGSWSKEIFNQPLWVDLFYLQLMESELDLRDESVFGVNVDWLVAGPDKQRQNLFNLILADINRGGRHALTVGGGVDFHLSHFWELFGELYGQFDHRSGVAGRAGARHTWFNLRSEPYVELGGIYVGRDFLSYENVDTFKIVQDEDLGLDIDRNYWGITLRTGLDLKPALERDVSLELRYGYFRRVARTGGLPARIGHEIDLEVRWLVNKSLTLGVGAATLLGSEALAPRPGRRATREQGSLFYLEAELRF